MNHNNNQEPSLHLPWRCYAKNDVREADWVIRDSKNQSVARQLRREVAEFIVRTANCAGRKMVTVPTSGNQP